MDVVEILKIGGGIAGFAALVWRVIDEFGSHLRISLKVDGPKDGWITAVTTVENKGNRPKKVSYACLLIGPEAEDPVTTAQRLAEACGYAGKLNYTNDLSKFQVRRTEIHSDRALIPIRFYYSENVDVADETLSYRVPMATSTLTPGSAYAVRFFLFPPAARLHRSTEDSFITLPASGPPVKIAPTR